MLKRKSAGLSLVIAIAVAAVIGCMVGQTRPTGEGARAEALLKSKVVSVADMERSTGTLDPTGRSISGHRPSSPCVIFFPHLPNLGRILPIVVVALSTQGSSQRRP